MEKFSFVWGENNTFYTAFPCIKGIFKKINLQYIIKKDENWEMTEAKLASRHSLRVYLEMLIIVLKALWEENKKLIGIESLLYSSTLPRTLHD